MKKRYLSSIAFVAVGLLAGHQAITNSSGAPAGSNGSPASNGNTCAQSGCHSGGPAQSSETISITTDIPASGFEAMDDYNITITADDGGRGLSRMGFQASVESNGNHVGALASTTNNTQTVGSYITHTRAGNSVSGGVKSWSFDWNSSNAPDSSQVYVAVNFSNANGANSGDVIVTETLLLRKDQDMSVPESQPRQVSLYPNPAREHLTVATDVPVEGPLYITDIKGATVKSVTKQARQDPHHWKISVEELSTGNYWLEVPQGPATLFRVH